MTDRVTSRIGIPLIFVLAVSGCAGSSPGSVPRPAIQPSAGLTVIAPADVPVGPGATVYVPVYSHVYASDSARPVNLAITLCVRNTDRSQPLFLTSVNYYGSDGRLVREELKAPLKVAPLAAAEFFVAESDTTGGSSASFLVNWKAGAAVAAPVVEAVMLSTNMNQGLSFQTTGRVIAETAP